MLPPFAHLVACCCMLLLVVACCCVLLHVVACCCVLLHIVACCCMLLDVVAQSLKLVKLLAPCKRVQHCWPTSPSVVGSCCVRLHVTWNSSNTVFKWRFCSRRPHFCLISLLITKWTLQTGLYFFYVFYRLKHNFSFVSFLFFSSTLHWLHWSTIRIRY